MEPWLYIVLTLGLFGATLASACVIQNIAVVFGFIGAFSLSAIVFTMPGMFYLMTDTKYSVDHSARRRMSVLFVCLGVAFSLFLLSAQVI